MQLELSLKQSLKLNPQMLQSMEILQMSTVELNEYVQELVQENPAAELVEPSAPTDESEELWQRVQSMADCDFQNRQYITPDREELDPLARVGTDGGLAYTLARHLGHQLSRMDLPADAVEAARFLAGCLDDNGYLRDSLEVLSPIAPTSPEMLGEGLRVLQSLEPAGVGARTLSECLLLQLERKGSGPIVTEVVRSHLERLGRKQYHAIAQALNVSQAQVRQAEKQIRELDPRPGAPFSSQNTAAYLIPDLAVVDTDSGLEVIHLDRRFPSLQVSSYYRSMQQTSRDLEVRKYLTEKVRQAQWTVQAVEQRRSTLLSCAQVIVSRQASFFRPEGSLAPLCLADVADALGVHESTVSRAVREKYLQCSRGVFPLSYFFSRQSSGGTSVHQIKALLARLIDSEDKRRPLSDQKLSVLLEGHGYEISRRTVAKYRDELGISSAGGRKES